MKQVIGWVVGSVFGVIALSFVLHAAGILDVKIFGVAEENARRQVFENTKSYVDGTRRDFDELILAYNKASDEEKPAIVSVMRHRAEGVPANLVPYEVLSVIRK